MIFLNLSVHNIVDLILRKGHLDTRVFNISSMLEGSRIHKAYQDRQSNNYIAEYYLSHEFKYEDFIIAVSGRADGVIKKNNNYIVDEIKSTVTDLDQFILDHGQWHLGQALLYGYMLCFKNKLEKVDIQMTYINQIDTSKIKQIKKTYSFKDLQLFVDDLMINYIRLYRKIYKFKTSRDEYVKTLKFPFPSYRAGQEKMISFVEKTIDNDKEVYIEAPTGIGKTISILYPAIKRFKLNKMDSIFYLTSKNSIKKIAMDTLSLFGKDSSKIKSIQLSSKDNMCLNDKKKHCNPEECFFAKHYYDKLNDAIFDTLELHSHFTSDVIKDLCFIRNICPFQFQLDLAKYCDVLVCDYNYIFDVNDFLSSDEIGSIFSRSILCVDESHNLPSRVKEMYSFTISLEYIDTVLNYCDKPSLAKLKKKIAKLYDYIEEISFNKEEVKNSIYELTFLDNELLNNIAYINTEYKKIFKSSPVDINDSLQEFYFFILDIDKILDLACGELRDYFNFYLIVENNKILSLNIQNIVSREIIKMKSQRFKSTIYFSGTLSPKDYYIDLLGGDINNKDNILALPSPFKKENRRVFVDTRYSLYYKDRDITLPKIYSLIKDVISQKVGNYFVYVPSFLYLDKLKVFFREDQIPNTKIYYQSSLMNEIERNDFLSHFKANSKRTNIGVLVLGGIFSEGIDLLGDRLIGSIIISVGLPLINYVKDKEAEFYNKLNPEINKGFDYAYTYPGINRILQAGGRVIRSDLDRGFILYCDSRLNKPLYRKIFNEYYPDLIMVKDNMSIKKELSNFFAEDNNGH